MATRTINTAIKLTGEAEYKKSLGDIGSQMSLLRAEMKKVAEEYKGQENSTDALRAKGEVLERQMSSQKSKVAILRREVDEASKAYKEGDSKLLRYKEQLTKAETELLKMERAQRENTDAMKGAGQQADETGNKLETTGGKTQILGGILEEVAGKFGISLPKSMGNTVTGLGLVNAAAGLTVAAIGALVTAVTKAEKKLADMTIESAAAADDILTMSLNTSISEETLQEWDYASELIDVDLETMTGSMAKMIKSMSSARDGTGDAAVAFSKLGVAVKDNATGELRNAEEVFFDCIDALGQIENSTERDATSMAIFGKSAQELNSLIEQGSDTLEGYAKEAHQVGYVLSTEQLAALGAVDDAQQRLLKSQQAVSQQISAEFAPYMEQALTKTAEFIRDIGEAIIDSGAVDSFGRLLDNATDLLEPLGELAQDAIPHIGEAMDNISSRFDNFLMFFARVEDIFGMIFDDFGTHAGWQYSQGNPSRTQIQEMRQNGTWDQYKEFYGLYGAGKKEEPEPFYYDPVKLYEGYWNASGTDNFPGGVTYISEAGPEKVILPQGTQILTAQESRESGGDTYITNVYVDKIEEISDVIRLAKNSRRTARMGGGK